jgi:hypothetical protein
LIEKWTHKFDTEVTGFALTDESYVSCTGNQYFLFKFSTEMRVKLNPSPIMTPYVVPLTSNSFVLVYKDFIMMAGNYNEKGAILQYDQSLGLPQSLLAVPDAIYIFFEECFTRHSIGTDDPTEPILFEIAGVRCAALADDSLLALTPTTAVIVGSMPPSEEMAKDIIDEGADEFDTVIGRLPRDAGSEAALAVFCELWRLNRPDLAFQLLSRHLIIGNIAAIVELVPLIALFGTPNPSLGLTPRPATEKTHVKGLTEALAFIRGEYLSDREDIVVHDLEVVDTAYAQCLSLQCTDLAHTRELDRVLKAKNVNIPHLNAFLSGETIRTFPECAPALGVFFANTEQVDRAMTIWRSLDAATMAQKKAARNPLFVTEAAYAVQMLTDPHALHEYLDWIFECDPVRPQTAITALLSPLHQPAVVEEWLKKKELSRSELVLRYHCFIVRQPNKARSAQHANNVLNQLLDVLADIDDDGFQVERLTFTETYQTRTDRLTDPEAFIAAAKEEITALVMHILQTNPESISATEALAHARDSVDKSVQLAIYQAKRQYAEGINYLVHSPGKFNFEEVAQFCRTAADPPAAFTAFLRKVGTETVINQSIRSLEENLAWIDIVGLVREIPAATRVKALEPLLKGAFNLMLQRKLNLDAQIALTHALVMDSRFRKADLQTGYCTIQKGTKCHVCQAAINDTASCVMAPGGSDGPVYHHHCKPVQKR